MRDFCRVSGVELRVVMSDWLKAGYWVSELECRNCWASEYWSRNCWASEYWRNSELWVSELWVSELWELSELLESELLSELLRRNSSELEVSELLVSPGFLFDLEVVGTAVLLVFSSTWRWSELRCSWFSLRPGGGRNCGAPGFLFDLEVVGTAVLLVFSSTWRWSELRCSWFSLRPGGGRNFCCLTRLKWLKTLQIVSELCVEGMRRDRRRSAAVDGIAEGQRLNFGIGVISLLRNGGSNFNSNVRQMGNFPTEFSE